MIKMKIIFHTNPFFWKFLLFRWESMFKAFKYRIYPTKEQETLIAKHIGAMRFIYNLALEVKQMAYSGAKVNLSGFDIAKQIPELKKECPWLKEINSQSLQKSVLNMESAFNNFFKGQADFPKYKRKTSARQSFCVPQSVCLEDGRLHIPKFKGGIELVEHRPLKGELKQATISRTPTGKYFVSILVETGVTAPEKKVVSEKATVGVDLGLKTFLVTSDGVTFDNPKHLRKAMDRLKFAQSRFSRFKGRRTKIKLTRMHEEVANKRRDFLHKTSLQLVKNHDSIAIEDLNISGMMKNQSLAFAIGDAGWATFVSMLEYKAEWYGRNILRIGRFDPSSKVCSCCGSINRELQLSDREWTCACGAIHDRDMNAAKNIKAFALEKHIKPVLGTRTKNHGELPTLVGALTREAHESLAHG